jgi:short-subunit dehydrogenase/pimeloyl-ACP methyl ester carboxylesterase
MSAARAPTVSPLTSYRGLTALVTGASSGIGRLLARRLAELGARLALVARREEELEKLAAEIRAAGVVALALACDVAERDQVAACVARALDRFGAVDLLVNNAGYGHHRPFLEWDLDDMERVLRVNYLGSLYFTKLLLPQMVERRRGWLVFVASVGGRIAPPEESAYAASKFAMVGLARALSLEVEDAGVHVLTVYPGTIRTPFFDEEALERMPPVGRRGMVEPEGLVNAILEALARGRREITYPKWIRSAYVVQALAPGLMRRQVRRTTLDAVAAEAGPSQGPRPLAGAVALAKAVGTLGRWYRRFDWTTGEDEHHVARTSDGWSLALFRYRSRGRAMPFPIVCGHGMAGTHLIFDLDTHLSLARYLADRGFDTWLVDLRGRGESWPAGGPSRALQWDFDDLARRDLPAAVARACELGGSRQAFWLGTGTSGQALYAAALVGEAEQVRGGVTLGAPATTTPFVRVPGVTAPPKMRWRGRVRFRTGSRLAGPVLAYARSRRLEGSFRACNTDPLVAARYLRNGVPDESVALVDQIRSWIEEGAMRSRDGSRIDCDRLGDVTLPMLLVAGAADLQAPPDAVAATFDALGSADKTSIRAGVREGFRVDYGHDDLVAGVASPAEIFPRIADWLAERSCT